jgi:hypothetical protein
VIGSKTPRDLAQSLADVALGGLLDERRASEKDGVPHVLGLLRNDLDRLEHMLDNG